MVSIAIKPLVKAIEKAPTINYQGAIFNLQDIFDIKNPQASPPPKLRTEPSTGTKMEQEAQWLACGVMDKNIFKFTNNVYIYIPIFLHIAQLNQPYTTPDYFHLSPPHQKFILGYASLPTTSYKNLDGNVSHLDP